MSRAEMIENLKATTFKLGSSGFVRLVDVMGEDSSIVQAARVSYGTGTKKVSDDTDLIRYLLRHRHTTPFEMCLSGDTRIPTFPGEFVEVKMYTLKEISDAFEKGGRENSWVKLLKIRTVNPETRVVTSTKIKRAWKSGIRKVFEITTESPFSRKIRVTDNHPILTTNGFSALNKGLSVGDSILHNGRPALSVEVVEEIKRRRKEGQTMKTVAEALGVKEGVVWKYAPGRGKRKTGYLKKEEGTHTDPREITRRRFQFQKCAVEGCETFPRDRHHIDENPHNNEVENVVGLCPKHHRHMHKMSRLEVAVPAKIISIVEIGEEDVYDLEVTDENHTFIAEGIAVHNCEVKLHIRIPMDAWRQFIRHRTASVNEYSTRYSEAIDDRAVTDPKAWRLQSELNKQGSSGLLEEWPEGSEFVDGRYIDFEGSSHPKASGPGEYLSRMESDFHHLANSLYKERLSFGVAREQARKDLPLSTYTEAYWKCDLHNIFHFLGLRMDSHAQLEIREYANVIGEQILSVLFPIAWKAFLDYRFNAVTLSAVDIITLRHVLGHVPVAEYGKLETIKAIAAQEIMNKRELSEFVEKWKKLVGYTEEPADGIKRD